MNKNRRKALSSITEQIEILKGQIEELNDQEREFLDNMPESFQSGTKGDKVYEAIDAMESAIGHLDDAIEDIELAKGEPS